MSDAPVDPGMLKSLADADNWVALYALPTVPFVQIVPLVKWGLLLQDHEQKLVGYVTGPDVRAVVADTPRRDGGVFCSYYRPIGIADYDTSIFAQLRNQVVSVGQMLAEAQDAEVIDE